MRLIDPKDPYTMVAIDPHALAELADFVIAAKYGDDWASEEAHEEHSFHDGDGEVDCPFCRIHRHQTGQGHQVAKAQFAMSLLSAQYSGSAECVDDPWDDAR